MLGRPNRITKDKEIKRIIRLGRTWSNPLFVLKSINNGLGFPRFGFIISNRVAKKAVTRNKLRRRLREVARGLLKEGLGNLDYLIIARKGLVNLDFAGLKQEIAKPLIKRARTIK